MSMIPRMLHPERAPMKGPPPPLVHDNHGGWSEAQTRRWAIEQSIASRGSYPSPLSIVQTAEAILAFVKGESR
jgi:hypothetical protein